MKTKTITLYTFDELPSEEAKQKARDWFLSGGDESTFAYEHIKDDAERIGLKIECLSRHRANEGEFIDGAFNCMNKILEEHGATCETYKTAQKYKAAWDDVPDQTTNLEEESRNAEMLDAIEHEFLCGLLEDYRIMWERETEYQSSDEGVDETLQANDYTFTETGKRED